MVGKRSLSGCAEPRTTDRCPGSVYEADAKSFFLLIPIEDLRSIHNAPRVWVLLLAVVSLAGTIWLQHAPAL